MHLTVLVDTKLDPRTSVTVAVIGLHCCVLTAGRAAHFIYSVHLVALGEAVLHHSTYTSPVSIAPVLRESAENNLLDTCMCLLTCSLESDTCKFHSGISVQLMHI